MPIEGEDHGQVETLDGSGSIIRGIEIGQTPVCSLLIGRPEQLVIDAIPVRVHLINALTTQLQLNFLHEMFSGVVRFRGTALLLEDDFQPHSGNQITIATDSDRDLLSKVYSTVKSLFDRFERKLGMSAIDNLPESDRWITSKIDILQKK